MKKNARNLKKTLNFCWRYENNPYLCTRKIKNQNDNSKRILVVALLIT